jgi:hypothetical protein
VRRPRSRAMPTSSDVTLLLIERMSCFVPASKLTERHTETLIFSGKVVLVYQSPRGER